MKKLLILILCIGLVFPTVAFGANGITIGFDTATKQGDIATLPMYISDIPSDLTNISALSLHMIFDTAVLEFIGLTDGSISSVSSWYNHSERNPNKVIFSWFDASASNENALTEASVGKNNPIFYAQFKIIDQSADLSWINIQEARAHDYSSNPAENINTVAGVVVISANIGDDNSGDGDSGDDNIGGDDGDGDTNDGNDDGNGDDNGTSDGDNNGAEGDNTGSTDNNNGGTTPGGDTGMLRPSTGNSKPSSGNNKVEEPKPTEPVVQPQPVPPTTTPEAPKASEIFSDVADNHWAAKSVVKLNQLGIVSGDSDKKANLDNKITRAETSKLALLVNGKDVKAGLALDVKDSADVPAWAKDYMSTAVAEGIFSGYEDGTIKPLNNITRAEMVAVIIKSLKIEVVADPALTFADNEAIGWAAPYVAKAVELGFVNGYEDNTFKPAKDITRAEAFAVFARVAEYLGK